jgi:hypothetical protein
MQVLLAAGLDRSMMALRDVMPSGTMGAMTLCPLMVRDGRNDRVGDICQSKNAQKQAGYGCTNNPAHILPLSRQFCRENLFYA